MVSVVVQVDGELGDLEQLPEQQLGRLSEIERHVGQRIQQLHVRSVRAAWLGLVGGVELGNGHERGGLLGVQVVVGAA
ncbi:hypothetical protein LWC34_02250 [Kibdelosporangium philippinense]|uniref:Uncharacterized protein n=1 Tax=Kibdelosporangium philippinense TaxID=211113 RepID=A0ABS8Z530_9PSEU|nr:hypothetical protein [Kibdelosporangium philippinense]MCE7001668.1 hypothetical protein [Kibdelosporangium philippinense]